MSDVRTIFGVGFGENHHIVNVINAFNANSDLDFRSTYFYRFLMAFTPSGTGEALLGRSATEDLPLFLYPWGTFRKGEFSTSKNAETSRFCGPSTDAFIEEEFHRTIALYQEMQTSGYTPTRFPHSYVAGTILVSQNGERRFVVLQGNHRIAAMACLGIREFEHWPLRGYLSKIHESEVERWPLVSSGRCSPDFALEIFRSFFGDNGSRIRSLVESRSED